MKKLALLLSICLICTLAIGQTTNYFWSANKTSNEIHAAISSRLGTNNTFIFVFLTNNPPLSGLTNGITTNLPITQLDATNYLWFTNGILTLITNSPS